MLKIKVFCEKSDERHGAHDVVHIVEPFELCAAVNHSAFFNTYPFEIVRGIYDDVFQPALRYATKVLFFEFLHG